jgi:hypothetical protein
VLFYRLSVGKQALSGGFAENPWWLVRIATFRS